MPTIRIDEALWASSMLPEGVVERWLVADGASVAAGAPVAVVRIEDALHDIVSPWSGRLRIMAARDALVEPGAILARIETAP